MTGTRLRNIGGGRYEVLLDGLSIGCVERTRDNLHHPNGDYREVVWRTIYGYGSDWAGRDWSGDMFSSRREAVQCIVESWQRKQATADHPTD
jgi:hypothetical protein